MQLILISLVVLVVLALALFQEVMVFKVEIQFFLPSHQLVEVAVQEFLLGLLVVVVDQVVAVCLGTPLLVALEIHQALLQAKVIMAHKALTMALFVLVAVAVALVPMAVKAVAVMELHHQ